ncbi:MAG TPA: pyridoxal-5-phosphate-dependent protein subunit beta [Candidatus Atribacteria bacterium]|uniref:Pyridoxal-5'-phosphate-dependent protein beta subunit n=1 Tax=candidate division TA06 bacterium 34_109 TaxID=1635277 RepID=A0A101I136_UNCT6|nr:MAG: Pyridoxal-5'-phosphate-dependent protein beta subunit [candidate division TA06 bacterium 34_109]HBY57667.1 pyridoxal-5-phosphate-dependent protein subunit beta [Candidatus Atribacteria bacterium]
MIDLTINEEQLQRTVQRARERKIIIPTFAQLKNPELIPAKIQDKLKEIGLWDINPYNLFRITWKNEPLKKGGLFHGVNYLELPSSLTGVKAHIIGLVGKWFPTGCHKVGATFGCLVPRLVTGQFDPTTQKAVWPSTGNYCRGGAYNAALLSCQSIAILPEGMSKERFQWLSKVAGEVIATPGTESNVKEIFDKTWELRKTRDNVVVFDQFEELGNYLWHYEVTGQAMEEVLSQVMNSKDHYAGVVLTTGSAGTLGCGDYLKELYPESKIAAGEALQCPTMLANGFGAHRIEGIGDKHIPWIHNVKNTDLVIAIDDRNVMSLIRLFNEPAGKAYLKEKKVPEETIESLPLMGISSVANLLMAIKFARYYELTARDVILTVFTDSMELYGSRLEELEEEYGLYTKEEAAIDFHRHLQALTTDYLQELTYPERKRIHNLKYFTWIEQQGKDLEELKAQWYDYENYWGSIHRQTGEIDKLIEEFNRRTGLLR